jgi:pentatricopeptide repeat protein
LARVKPNHFTYSSVLKACANLSDLRLGEQVYSHAVKLGHCVGNSLISMYARSGMMEDARKAFDMLFEKNLVSYNTAVDGHAKNLKSEEAFQLFHEIEDAGLAASAFTYASLLSGAASIGAIGKGEQIHASVLKSGFESNQCISNALISMYSTCGNIDSALNVFNDMGDRNVISWTSMITGFAKHGFASRAMKFFHKMLEVGVRPNEITYIAVLSACSHVGLFLRAGNTSMPCTKNIALFQEWSIMHAWSICWAG